MLAYVHKYLCYSAEQSLKRNEVFNSWETWRERSRIIIVDTIFRVASIINPFNDIIPSMRIIFFRS